MWDWIVTHKEEIPAVAGLGLVLVMLVISATPSKKDDRWLRRTIRRFKGTWRTAKGEEPRDTVACDSDPPEGQP